MRPTEGERRDDSYEILCKTMAKFLDTMLENQEEVPTALWNAVERLLREDARAGTLIPCFSTADGRLKVKVLHTDFLIDLWEDDIEDIVADCLDVEEAQVVVAMLESALAKTKEYVDVMRRKEEGK